MSVRISGLITKKKLNLLKSITRIINSTVNESHDYWQYFPFLLDEKLDDKYLVVLRFVKSNDGFKATVKYDDILIKKLAKKILKTHYEVGRVFFDVSPKPPVTIEFM